MNMDDLISTFSIHIIQIHKKLLPCKLITHEIGFSKITKGCDLFNPLVLFIWGSAHVFAHGQN